MSRAKPWEVWTVDFGEPVGSEQGGRRPAVVVASSFHADLPVAITLVLPLTSRNRGLPHHVAVKSPESGLDRLSFARTEEVTAVSEKRFLGRKPLGRVHQAEANEIQEWVRQMII
jgi:mRNA interferase MazF